MIKRVVGYCIIDTETGERWGELYESQGGAKSSFNNWVRKRNYYKDRDQPKFNDQVQYVIKEVWLLDE